MTRLNARWDNFWHRGQAWYSFWQDVEAAYEEEVRNWGWPLRPYSEEKEQPVVAGSLFTSLVDQYGATMGLHVFQQMYAERKGPFQPDAKYDPEKPSVARKVAKAGGVIPDPQAQLRAFIGKKLRR